MAGPVTPLFAVQSVPATSLLVLPQRVGEEVGILHCQISAAGLFSVRLVGRSAPDAPFVTIATVSQADTSFDGSASGGEHGCAAVLVKLFPETRAVLDSVTGTFAAWLSE